MYKAVIDFRAIEDSYTEGENLNADNSWVQTYTADTKSELRDKILEVTYSEWQYVDKEQINEYDWCTEYHTSYLANADNQGEATPQEIEAWKRGKCRLWSIDCHILVTEVIETKTSLGV